MNVILTFLYATGYHLMEYILGDFWYFQTFIIQILSFRYDGIFTQLTVYGSPHIVKCLMYESNTLKIGQPKLLAT